MVFGMHLNYQQIFWHWGFVRWYYPILASGHKSKNIEMSVPTLLLCLLSVSFFLKNVFSTIICLCIHVYIHEVRRASDPLELPDKAAGNQTYLV